MTSITIPNSVTSIGNYAFSGCSGLTSVTIPDSVTRIYYCAFNGCSGLTSVHISDIAKWCAISFTDCYANPLMYAHNLYVNGVLVKDLIIPNRVTSIGDYAFYGCSGLTSVTIPNSVTSIGDSAFEGCGRLIEVYNKSTLSITAGSSSNGYVAYYAKNVYTTEGGSKLTTDENGYVIYTDGDEKILVAYLGTNTELVLPSYITKINQYAFYDCTGLTSVTIPDSVTSIGDSAFYGCEGLTNITIPDSVTSIGDDAFSFCSDLTRITIPDSVTSIGNSAFYGCRGLTSITIPDSVTSIGEHAFRGCTNLTRINFNGTKAQWSAISKGQYWKYNVPSACKVICKDGTVSI